MLDSIQVIYAPIWLSLLLGFMLNICLDILYWLCWMLQLYQQLINCEYLVYPNSLKQTCMCICLYTSFNISRDTFNISSQCSNINYEKSNYEIDPYMLIYNSFERKDNAWFRLVSKFGYYWFLASYWIFFNIL